MSLLFFVHKNYFFSFFFTTWKLNLRIFHQKNGWAIWLFCWGCPAGWGCIILNPGLRLLLAPILLEFWLEFEVEAEAGGCNPPKPMGGPLLSALKFLQKGHISFQTLSNVHRCWQTQFNEYIWVIVTRHLDT